MDNNESEAPQDFLVPSSIQRMMQTNRQCHALQTERSNASIKKTFASPKNSQADSDYTFEPRVNSSQRGRRSLDRFVEDQEKYQVEKERKLTEMREEITRWEDEQLRTVPRVNSGSKSKALSRQKSSSVFQRLSRERHSRQLPSAYSFSPSILQKSKDLPRQKSGTDLLYEDAKRRSLNKKVTRQSQYKKITALSTPKINSNTNDLVRKKVLAEFMQLISDSVINPLLALSILEELFNIKLRDTSSPLVRRIIELIADSQEEVLTEKLWSFIAVIIGNSQGCFPEEEEAQIKAHYGYFYKERINKEKRYEAPDVPEFQPTILDNAESLAGRYREKACKKATKFISQEKGRINIENEVIALEDLFILEHMQRRKENERLKIEKENLEVQQCTFKPKLTSSKTLLRPKQKIVLKYPVRPKNPSSLLASHEPTQRRILASKCMNSVEQSKENTERVCISQQKKAQIYQRNRKSVENISIRMVAARAERECQRKMSLRGYSKEQNWNRDCIKKHKQVVENAQRMRGFKQSG